MPEARMNISVQFGRRKLDSLDEYSSQCCCFTVGWRTFLHFFSGHSNCHLIELYLGHLVPKFSVHLIP